MNNNNDDDDDDDDVNNNNNIVRNISQYTWSKPDIYSEPNTLLKYLRKVSVYSYLKNVSK